MTSVMDSIRDFEGISFKDIEQVAFRIACKTQVKAMEISLKELDDERYIRAVIRKGMNQLIGKNAV